MRRELDHHGVAVMTVGVVAIALLFAPLGGGLVEKTVRVVVGVPLVLGLPGHAILLALRTRRLTPQGVCDGSAASMERWAWTIALSVGVAVLGAFVLNLFPGGLTRTNWLTLLGGTTVLAAAAAVPRGITDTPREPAPNFFRTGRIRIRDRRVAATLAGATVIAVAAVWIGVMSAANVPQPGFAQLWLIPTATSGGIDASGGRTSVTAAIGVHSYEVRGERLRVELHTDTGAIQTWAFDLQPGDQWRQQIELPHGHTFTAQLYRNAEQIPYRRVWLHVG